MGGKRVNVLPGAGRLKGHDDYVDAYQYNFNLMDIKFDEFSPKITIEKEKTQFMSKLWFI